MVLAPGTITFIAIVADGTESLRLTLPKNAPTVR